MHFYTLFQKSPDSRNLRQSGHFTWTYKTLLYAFGRQISGPDGLQHREMKRRPVLGVSDPAGDLKGDTISRTGFSDGEGRGEGTRPGQIRPSLLQNRPLFAARKAFLRRSRMTANSSVHLANLFPNVPLHRQMKRRAVLGVGNYSRFIGILSVILRKGEPGGLPGC
jgi:hypothetical protein